MFVVSYNYRFKNDYGAADKYKFTRRDKGNISLVEDFDRS